MQYINSGMSERRNLFELRILVIWLECYTMTGRKQMQRILSIFFYKRKII